MARVSCLVLLLLVACSDSTQEHAEPASEAPAQGQSAPPEPEAEEAAALEADVVEVDEAAEIDEAEEPQEAAPVRAPDTPVLPELDSVGDSPD